MASREPLPRLTAPLTTTPVNAVVRQLPVRAEPEPEPEAEPEPEPETVTERGEGGRGGGGVSTVLISCKI